MGHTFISYAREDRARVKVFARALEGAGIVIWFDERLIAGSHFDSAIEQALEDAERVIVVWSQISVDSRWVRAEAGDGLERGILIPVLLEPTRVPLEFRRVQAVDLTAWDGRADDENFRRLLEAICSTTPSPNPSPHYGWNPTDDSALPQLSNKVTAELVFTRDSHSAFKAIIRSGKSSTTIDHAIRGMAQEVRVDDVTIHRGRIGSFKEHLCFPINLEGKEMLCDLTLYRVFWRVTGYRLLIDSEEVLRGDFKLRGLFFETIGIFIIVAVCFEIFLLTVDPLDFMDMTVFRVLIAILCILPLVAAVVYHLIRSRKQRAR